MGFDPVESMDPERKAFHDFMDEILVPNADQDMADSGSAEATDSGSAEATDCSMLPTAATICLQGIHDPEQIRQVIKARILDLRSVLHVEVATCQLPVISGKELAAFSKHASPGDACIVVEERVIRLTGTFPPVRQGTPNPVRWREPRVAGGPWKRTVGWKNGSDDDVYAPPAPCLHLKVGAGWESLAGAGGWRILDGMMWVDPTASETDNQISSCDCFIPRARLGSGARQRTSARTHPKLLGRLKAEVVL